MKIFGHVRNAYSLDNVEDKHRVVCRERSAAFGDDVGMRYLVFVGSIDEGVNTVVDIFLNGIVHRTGRVARTRSVIVYAKTAAAVNKFNIEAHGVQLHIELCRLAQSGGDATYFGYLAADVEVYELQAVAHAHLVECLQSLEQLTGVKAEL